MTLYLCRTVVRTRVEAHSVFGTCKCERPLEAEGLSLCAGMHSGEEMLADGKGPRGLLFRMAGVTLSSRRMFHFRVSLCFLLHCGPLAEGTVHAKEFYRCFLAITLSLLRLLPNTLLTKDFPDRCVPH
ncbi:hypothetical protein CDAR_515531 [Caerostris darwini]|uniref:Uncharacterized protein n=1 Tax=Caerostris darwini TaxID=1538125 RepID=A0AAV4S4F0_9ARAC|nr:hypothetical protein CDAR_515531 [Caerostris darwini]